MNGVLQDQEVAGCRRFDFSEIAEKTVDKGLRKITASLGPAGLHGNNEGGPSGPEWPSTRGVEGAPETDPYALQACRVRVKRALNCQTDLPHARSRERARQTLSDKRFLECRNEVALHPGRPWQSRLAGFKSHGRGTVCTLAAEGNDQNGVDSFAEITGVERHDQDPMADWRVSQHRGPDLAAPGRSVMAGQSPSLEIQRSGRLRDRPLPRRLWGSGL